MTTTSLSILLARLKKTNFPEFPDDETFSNWVAELEEMDGHIVGLAQQTEAGQQIDRRALQSQVAELRASFDSFRSLIE